MDNQKNLLILFLIFLILYKLDQANLASSTKHFKDLHPKIHRKINLSNKLLYKSIVDITGHKNLRRKIW